MTTILDELGALASTSPPALRPDLVPGSDSHDALDHDPAAVVPRPLPAGGPTASEEQAAADLDASIAAAREQSRARDPLHDLEKLG